MSVLSRRNTDEPAEEASRLLLRIGVFLLFVISLIAPILARQTVYVLLPIGAALLLAAATLTPEEGSGRSMRSILLSPPFLAALLLAAWTALSLLWTPFEGPAERFAENHGDARPGGARHRISAAAHQNLKSQPVADRRRRGDARACRRHFAAEAAIYARRHSRCRTARPRRTRTGPARLAGHGRPRRPRPLVFGGRPRWWRR